MDKVVLTNEATEFRQLALSSVDIICCLSFYLQTEFRDYFGT